MAKVYEHQPDGGYQYNDNYEVDGLSVEDAIDEILGDRDDVDKYWLDTNKFRWYGERAVVVEVDNGYGDYIPYLIIGND